MTYTRLTRDQHFQMDGPKRILALDGGGIRGIATLSYLKAIEDLLRIRHGDDDGFRLAHYFDLIAGTSTGAIIAAGLARGMKVDEVTEIYLRLGKEVFWRSPWRKGILRPRYDHEKLTEHLQSILGRSTSLGDPALLTGLLVVTKRMDTGSPWPLGNNPRGRYFAAKEGDRWISNRDYPLWRVVRASTAAPSFFKPEAITISQAVGLPDVVGEFVDGGVSPFNNPTLQAFMYATLSGFRVGWQTGEKQMLVISVGTGSGDPGKAPTWITAKGALQSLLALMDDNGVLVETIVQWMSTGHTHRMIDREIGDLGTEFMCREPMFTYERFDLSLTRDALAGLKPGISDAALESLTSMDEPDNMALLKTLADLDAAVRIDDRHFPAEFNLK